MIGLPGQTLETVAEDLLLLKEIGCDMAGIGPFLPHPDTPLKEAKHGSAQLTLRAVAIARMLLPKANLPATTALGVLYPDCKDLVVCVWCQCCHAKSDTGKTKTVISNLSCSVSRDGYCNGQKTDRTGNQRDWEKFHIEIRKKTRKLCMTNIP